MTEARNIQFTVPGRLRGKGRPRARVRGNFAHIHTDEKTANAEAMVRDFAAKAMAGASLLEGALILDVVVNLLVPTSWSKKKRAENPIPTGKPDLDNVVKLIGDSLNGIIWQDDSQVAELSIIRRFVEIGGESVSISVSEMAA